MFNYFQQFNKLPKDLRDKISTRAIMREIDTLEMKYKIGLAVVIMKIMVKSVSREDLPSFFIKEFGLDSKDADALTEVLYEKVLNSVAGYLKTEAQPKKEDAKPKKENVTLDTKHELAPPPPSIISQDKKKDATRDFTREKEDVADEIGSKLEELFKNSEKDKKEEPVEAEDEIDSLLKEVEESKKKGEKKEKEIRITKEELAKEGFIKEDDIDKKSDGVEKEFIKPEEETKKDVFNKDFGDRIEGKIDKIIAEIDIKFGSEDLLHRFQNILSTYLKGVRGKIDTKNTLNKAFASGGMNFDDETINKVFKVSNKIESEEQKVLEEDIKKMSRSAGNNIFEDEKNKTKTTEADYNLLSSLKEQKKIKEDEGEEETKKPLPETKTPSLVNEKKKVEDAEVSALPVKKAVEQVEEPKKDLLMKEIKKEELEKVDIGNQIVQPQPQAGKLMMEDIKQAPKVMGPVDELRYLGLTDFRRLTEDPVEMTQKIKEKIKLLEEESYGKMIDGILAWRHSPVNRLYLETAYQGISSGMKLEDVIKQREKEQKEFLDMNEIDALINLNNELMF